MRRLLSNACIILLFAGQSCMKEYDSLPGKAEDDVSVRLSLTLANTPSKSSFCPEELDKISDINVWIYQEGVLIRDYSFYCSMPGSGSLDVSFPSRHSRYNLYLLANAGEIEAPDSEKDIGNVKAVFTDYSSFSQKGFPMAGRLPSFLPSGSGHATLCRLVGRYDIQARFSPGNRISYTFLSGKMKSCARAVRPFGNLAGMDGYASRAVSKEEIIEEGDALSSEDIATLNSGGVVTLYYLENCQGELLPGNTSRFGKSAEAIDMASGEPGRSGLCSFLELCCKAVTPTATYESVYYRAFLGRNDCSDFSIVRNTFCPYLLDVVSTLVSEYPWFVEPDNPEITGTLCFADTRYTGETAPEAYKNSTVDNRFRPFRKVDSFWMMKGFTAYYYIYRSNPEIDYVISIDKAGETDPCITYKTSTLDEHFTALRIDTSMPLTKDGTNAKAAFILRSTDGLIRDTMTVGVLGQPPSLKILYDSGTGQLVAETENPMNLMFYVNISGTLYGSSSKNIRFTVGGLSDISSGGFNVDSGEYILSDRSIYPLPKCSSFKQVLDAMTATQKAVPSGLVGNISIKYDSPNEYRLLPLDTGIPLRLNQELTVTDGNYCGAGTDMGICTPPYYFRRHYNLSSGNADPGPYSGKYYPAISMSIYDGSKYTEKWDTEAALFYTKTDYGMLFKTWPASLGFSDF